MHRYRVLEEGKPLAQARNAVILLHGRGGNAEDIISLAGEFCDDTFYIAAPQAENNAWYPYTFLSPVMKNEPWLSSAIQTVKRLADGISAYLPVENIYLMGFSQGACLALEYVARNPGRYAGVAAFSGGLIGDFVNQETYRGDLQNMPVYIGVSAQDPHIPADRARESAVVMRNLGGDVTLRIYPGMSHTITDDEISTVRDIMFIPSRSQ